MATYIAHAKNKDNYGHGITIKQAIADYIENHADTDVKFPQDLTVICHKCDQKDGKTRLIKTVKTVVFSVSRTPQEHNPTKYELSYTPVKASTSTYNAPHQAARA